MKLALLVGSALLLSACASGLRPQLVAPPEPTATPFPEGSLPADGTGTITVGAEVFALSFACLALDDGSLLFVGHGEPAPDGDAVTGIVRTRPGGTPYVAVLFGDVEAGSGYESAIDAELTVQVDDTEVVVDAVPFVATGDATPIGDGAAQISCERFEEGAAADYDL